MDDPRSPALDPGKLDELRELLGAVGEGSLEVFLGVFLSSTERSLRDLRSAVADRDAAEVERCAHLLKGAGGNVGAERLADACRRMEESARGGREGDLGLAGVEAEYARVRAALEPLRRGAPPQEAGR